MALTMHAARKIATEAGYTVYEGSLRGTTDDRLGRWYYDHTSQSRRPYGAGHATKTAAWIAAAEHVQDAAASQAAVDAGRSAAYGDDAG